MNNKLVAVALAAGIASGCSSIVSKSDYAVAVNSNPGGANFAITNRGGQTVQSGVTPSTVTLKSSSGFFKGETYQIELTKDGYSPKVYTLSSNVDGWYFGNILFGGLIGMLIVDPATGAMYKLPERADISLESSTAPTEAAEAAETGETGESASVEARESFTIATIDSLTDQQRSQLVKLN